MKIKLDVFWQTAIILYFKASKEADKVKKKAVVSLTAIERPHAKCLVAGSWRCPTLTLFSASLSISLNLGCFMVLRICD